MSALHEQAIADAHGSTVAVLLKPLTKAFDSILERRLLPIRSITAQVRYFVCSE